MEFANKKSLLSKRLKNKDVIRKSLMALPDRNCKTGRILRCYLCPEVGSPERFLTVFYFGRVLLQHDLEGNRRRCQESVGGGAPGGRDDGHAGPGIKDGAFCLLSIGEILDFPGDPLAELGGQSLIGALFLPIVRFRQQGIVGRMEMVDATWRPQIYLDRELIHPLPRRHCQHTWAFFFSALGDVTHELDGCRPRVCQRVLVEHRNLR